VPDDGSKSFDEKSGRESETSLKIRQSVARIDILKPAELSLTAHGMLA